ncbi:Pfs, NACHT and ankyrin domain protein [Xylaria curta]|nr:Pfs, NACHT and ankyrin domain protein [Xylaria curta]
MSIQIYTHKYFFGTPRRTLATYIADTSGPHENPYPKSNVPPLKTQLGQRVFSGEGEELGDLRSFFQVMGTAHFECPFMLKGKFRPEILRLNPSIVDVLINFDSKVPWLARGIPSFIMPEPYRLRKALEPIQKRATDGDPFWGSAMNRWRHDILPKTGYHDEDALAAADLGLAFGLITNLNPSTMLAVWHIFRDPDLLQRLTKLPLLSSIYAETLRLYINTFIMVNSAQCDMSLRKWRLPQNELGLLNSHIAHRDDTFWNTKNGPHPVDTFWADRFVTDPADPTSGPINPELYEARRRNEKNKHRKSYFSMEGLKASWFPYGVVIRSSERLHGPYLLIFMCALPL